MRHAESLPIVRASLRWLPMRKSGANARLHSAFAQEAVEVPV